MNNLQNYNLISFLGFIKSNDYDKVKEIISNKVQILEVFEFIEIITIITSDNPLKIELTALGSSLLSKDETKNYWKEQDNILHSITVDLQHIKSSLSAISLDMMRSQEFTQDNSYDSGLLWNKNEVIQDYKNNQSNKNLDLSKLNSTTDEIKAYIVQLKENLSPEELVHLKKTSNLIIKNYNSVNLLLEQNKFYEFGLESYLLIDAIFFFVLRLFNKNEPNIADFSLKKKFQLLKNFHLLVDNDLIQFLNKFYFDIQIKNEESLKIGKRTAKELLKLINRCYQSFTSLFEELF